MTEEEQFKQILNQAVKSRSDIPPETPQEFDIYCDMHYNLYMRIKKEWVNIGLNVSPLN